MSKVIISDTSCLIILDKIGKLEFLKLLFEQVVITEEVKKEFGVNLPNWIIVNKVQNAQMTIALNEQVELELYRNIRNFGKSKERGNYTFIETYFRRN